MEKSFIVGDKIYLRPVESADIERGYLDWINHEPTRLFMGTLHFPQTAEMLDDYIRTQNANPNMAFFAIVQKSDDQYIGNIKLGPIDWINRKAEFGHLIGNPNVRGKGYGTEAVRLVVKYAFMELNLHKVTSSCSSQNIASTRTIEKNGLVEEGRVKEAKYEDGVYQDLFIYGITRQEYMDFIAKK